MARIYAYVTFAVVLALLMQISDFQTTTPQVLEQTGLIDVEGGGVFNFDSDFFSDISNILTLLGIGVIAVGLFVNTNENLLVASVVLGSLLAFTGSMWSVVTVSAPFANYIKVPIRIFMGALTVGYIISLAEFVRGNI